MVRADEMDKRGEGTHDPTAISLKHRRSWGLVATTGFLIYLLLFRLSSWGIPSTPVSGDSPIRYAYPGENIEWERCGQLENGRPLEVSIRG